MDLQKLSESELTKWLEGELRFIKVSLTDSIAEKGLVDDIGWKEIGWRAAIRYTGNMEIPEERFDSLERFGELVALIRWWHERVSQKVEVLAVA